MTNLLKAVAAFVACPGMVAGAVPALVVWSSDGLAPAHPLGLAVLGVGVVGLMWSVREFYVSGSGTLAPWDPPRRLVTVGPYRFSRNPMYVAVSVMLLGWAWVYASLLMIAYALMVMLAFALRVVHGEEPWLRRTHGDAWEAYAKQVRRWM